MASTYWIKLYHEILNDPKMGRLPDRLWRRVIECFLLAGETEDDRFLPAVEDMAWTLRCSPSELELELQEVAKLTGILELKDGFWFVVRFSDRQSAASSTERVKRHRETKMKRNVSPDVSQNAQNETDIEREKNLVRERERRIRR